jgi:hypothetical protein
MSSDAQATSNGARSMSANNFARGDSASFASTMTRKGCLSVATSRTVSDGSSSCTVPMPDRMAQARARQR